MNVLKVKKLNFVRFGQTKVARNELVECQAPHAESRQNVEPSRSLGANVSGSKLSEL